MNTEKCDEWVEQRQSPSPRNPRTNRAIKIGGPKYKELDKDCDEFIKNSGGLQPSIISNRGNPQQQPESICDEWVEQRQSPSPRNPRTRRAIKKDGPKYKELDIECNEFINEGQQPLIDLSSGPQESIRSNLIRSITAMPSLTPSQIDQSICDEWVEERRNPNPINPLTQKSIKKDGPKYKELDQECNEFINGEEEPKRVVTTLPTRRASPGRPRANPPGRPKNKARPQIQDVRKMPWFTSKRPVHGMSPSPELVAANSVANTVANTVPQLNRNFYSVTERYKNGVAIKNYFSSLVVTEGQVCMSSSKTLLKYVKNSKLLGYGSFGTVYSATIPHSNISVAIKEGTLTVDQYKKAVDKQYPMEYLYNKFVNDLIDFRICPNFTATYAIFFCDKCELTLLDENLTSQCSETITELFDRELDGDISDDKVLESILFQVLFAVASIQLTFGMFHNDIKSENVLLKVIPSGGYWEYNLDGQTYNVPNYGYIAALNDFGVSQSFMPGISQAEYGKRQAEVVLNSSTGEPYFKPFTTKTGNVFHMDYEGEEQASIPVDLKNFRRFPVHQFNFDIVDTIFMFIGGDRASQSGRHTSLTDSKHFRNLLSDFKKISDGDFNPFEDNQYDIEDEWPVDGVYLFLANQAIRKIFTFYINRVLDGPKIETYML